jgi:hypothetical protein
MAADAGRRGYTLLLDALWIEARTLKLRLRTAGVVSASAFCVARHKLSKTLMSQLLQKTARQTAKAAGESGKWKGRRLYAIDGSKISLPRSPALFEAFGRPTGAHCPQMLALVLMDVVLKQALAFATAPYRGSERTEFIPLLSHVARGAILLLDRGFEAFAVFRLLKQRRIDFVIRCKTSKSFRLIENFVRSGRREAWLTLDPPPHSDQSRPLGLRAVRCDLPEGRVEVLVTTLSEEKASAKEVSDLYWKRWRIEGYFRELKARWFSPRQFHSRSVAGVEQELGAQVLFTAIMSALLISAAARHDVPFDEISRKAALLRLVSSITRLVLLVDQASVRREIRELLADIARRRYKQRPGRLYPRVSFAPRSKWGPLGANGTHRNGRTR